MNQNSAKRPDDPLDGFLQASAFLTGYDRVELLGTGQARLYYEVLLGAAGSTVTRRLLGHVLEVAGSGGGDVDGQVDKQVQAQVFDDPQIGPPAARLIALWFTGIWNAMDGAWHARYAGDGQDFTHVVSPESYRQGLQWPNIGSHPQGAKQPGFATWSFEPAAPPDVER